MSELKREGDALVGWIPDLSVEDSGRFGHRVYFHDDGGVTIGRVSRGDGRERVTLRWEALAKLAREAER